MPIQRFRTHDEAREALWGRGDDPAYLRRVEWLWAFSEKLHRPRFPRGVHRYRTIEDAQRAREEWESRREPGDGARA